MKKILGKFLDLYLKFPFSIDALLCIIIIVLNTYCPILTMRISNKDLLVDYLSNLIGTSVSLAGFILAALTIVVTFKANLSARGYSEAKIALDFLFTPKNYKTIVRVYRHSITELVTVFVVLYITWFNAEAISINCYTNVLVLGTTLILTSTIRSLMALFKILDFEVLDKKL